VCAEPFGSDFHTILCYSHIVHKLALYTLGTNHMMRIHTCNSALSVEHTHTHTLLDWFRFGKFFMCNTFSYSMQKTDYIVCCI